MLKAKIMKLSALLKSKKFVVLLCTGVFVGVTLQFSSPEITNPPVVSQIDAPDEVRTILERACYDCHSNQSKPAWIDQIAPVSYLVASDIKEARSRFNLSDWNSIPKPKQEVLLWEIVNAIEQGEMPLKNYLAVHPSAKITKDELNTLKKYVNTLPGRKQVDTTPIIKNTRQTAAAAVPRKVPTSLNGISYSADYKSWKVISSTDKYDSGTMRVVYGNDIMVKALQNGTMPFPDGAKIVKAVWNVKPEDKDGNVFPANFVNVQIMLKDSKRFKDTEGWGFAKFDGLDLLPYGKTANYATACINCHRLLVPENDFVFNIPTK
jgi:hypothetical protein